MVRLLEPRTCAWQVLYPLATPSVPMKPGIIFPTDILSLLYRHSVLQHPSLVSFCSFSSWKHPLSPASSQIPAYNLRNNYQRKLADSQDTLFLNYLLWRSGYGGNSRHHSIHSRADTVRKHVSVARGGILSCTVFAPNNCNNQHPR